MPNKPDTPRRWRLYRASGHILNSLPQLGDDIALILLWQCGGRANKKRLIVPPEKVV